MRLPALATTALALTLALLASAPAPAQAPSVAPAQLSPELESKVATVADAVLKDTGVPSASVAIVQNGRLVYAHAFGLANVQPPKPATADMAFPIGSISKQFTAQAILLLQQGGKLSVDDPVAKYFPNFTRAREVTLRNLMTMTSGYEDFAPQDYIIPAWRHPIDPLANVTQWASKPLDFEPGTEWQYSNTNYVILGLIVEKVSGQPLMQFLSANLLSPLHLQGVFNTYTERDKLQVTGYVSHALAPVRVLPLEGTGWYFGDGDLAMPASTLAAWDIAIMQQSLLSPASYKQFETPFVFKNGKPSTYGLGTFVRDRNGHRELEHSGEVGGYVSENILFPDDGLAIVVLTNQVASEAAAQIGQQLTSLLLPAAAAAATATAPDPLASQLKSIMAGLQHSQIDRSLFTPDCNDYFSPETLADFQSTLAPLGAVTSVTRLHTAQRGGMTLGIYRVSFSTGAVIVSTYLTPDNKLEQLLVVAKA
ncbi:MAG TPA: serine hydrolase domain-containing protein [Acidobacteriaceae bacterium]|nr:serine hydrolase domain-containing protein [Acidobacteriaceae bacterium]